MELKLLSPHIARNTFYLKTSNRTTSPGYMISEIGQWVYGEMEVEIKMVEGEINDGVIM